MSVFKHRIPVQIRFADIDRLDHVNNACYLSYFELGRVAYFNQVLGNLIDWNKEGFILARTEIDHILPLHLNDRIWCDTRVSKLGTKSITMENVITREKDGGEVECASGAGVLVAMDYIKREPVELPVRWRKAFADFEGL